MWRPKDWKNYCGIGFKFGGWTCPDEGTRLACMGIYEAGADAMLEVLRGQGEVIGHLYGHSIIGTELECAGKWVFIPDEETSTK